MRMTALLLSLLLALAPLRTAFGGCVHEGAADGQTTGQPPCHELSQPADFPDSAPQLNPCDGGGCCHVGVPVAAADAPLLMAGPALSKPLVLAIRPAPTVAADRLERPPRS